MRGRQRQREGEREGDRDRERMRAQEVDRRRQRGREGERESPLELFIVLLPVTITASCGPLSLFAATFIKALTPKYLPFLFVSHIHGYILQ